MYNVKLINKKKHFLKNFFTNFLTRFKKFKNELFFSFCLDGFFKNINKVVTKVTHLFSTMFTAFIFLSLICIDSSTKRFVRLFSISKIFELTKSYVWLLFTACITRVQQLDGFCKRISDLCLYICTFLILFYDIYFITIITSYLINCVGKFLVRCFVN